MNGVWIFLLVMVLLSFSAGVIDWVYNKMEERFKK